MNNPIRYKFFVVCFIVFLFVVGVVHWLSFFNFGDLAYSAYDWPKEIKCFSVLSQALRQGVMPYHTSEYLPYDATDRFLALPEIILSPQIILLKFVSPGNFILLNTLFMYSIGFIGCLLIKRRYKLSVIPFTFLYLLFNFNGHITSHIAIGHSMWNGYFLLPFFVLFILELIEDKDKAKSIVKLSLISFLIILQGAWHMFVWCLLLMVLLAIFNKIYRKPVLYTIILSILLSCFRILPATITFYNKGYKFMTGFPTIRDLFDALTMIRSHTYQYLGGIMANLGSWEYDTFIDIIGLAVIIYFGIYLRFAKNKNIKDYEYKQLDMPVALMTLFSMSSFYGFIAMLPIPLFNSMRVPSRFLIMPVLMLVVISCIRIEQIMPDLQKKLWVKLLSAIVLLQLFFALIGHSKTWRIATIEKEFTGPIIEINTKIISIPDVFYENCVKFSAFISLLTIAFLIVLFLQRLIKQKT